jgi:histidyl-tRNA synthetase
VKEELAGRGLSTNEISIIENYLSVSGSNEQKIARARQLLGSTDAGKKGIEDLERMLTLTTHNSRLTIDFTLARGLNYYTGIIFEVQAKGVQIGSIGGGGRYDDLTGLFGVPNIPGVGISFGVDRIYDVIEELQLFPEDVYTGTKVLFFNLGETECRAALVAAQHLRRKNIACEVYHESAKFDKQFKYAEKKKIPFIAIIGEQEIKSNSVQIKNMAFGEQREIKLSELLEFSFS